MVEERIPEEPAVERERVVAPAPVPPSTVIVTDRPRTGGAGWLVAIVVLLVILVAIWAFARPSTSEVMSDNAVTNAADRVGNAADKVGDAASRVGTAAEDTAHDAAKTADRAADDAGAAVTVTTGTSQQPADTGSGD